MTTPTEPIPETHETVGRLCAAWAFLEVVTEITLRGILTMDSRLSRVFLWKMGMRERWALLINESKDALSQDQYDVLKTLHKKVVAAMTDRNIIVHGVIHAITNRHGQARVIGQTIPQRDMKPDDFVRTPCWTIYMGEGKGKLYPVSATAVSIVMNNIQSISTELVKCNVKHGFDCFSEPHGEIEKDWPKPIQ